jgi:hypothetical protein
MNRCPFRFTTQWALVGVISFYAVATAMVAWHRQKIVTPTSVGGSESATMHEMPNLPEPSRCNASRRVAGDYGYNSATGIGLIPSDEDGPNLEKLCGDIFGTSTRPSENPDSYAHNFDLLDSMIADSAAANIGKDGPMSYSKDEQKTITMTELGTEQLSNGSDTNETSPGQNIEKTSYIDTVITSTPAIQALTKIRTKAKCVETILRKAVIEPYHINGQIEGLQITGLDKILLARDLLLKSGDIIRAVNGHPLNSKRRAYEIFKRARKLPTMKIELLRDGKTETFLYYLR